MKNAKLDDELREKKRQMEEIVRNVTSWKKSIKDRRDSMPEPETPRPVEIGDQRHSHCKTSTIKR